MYEETFRFYSGNAIEDAFDMRMTGDFSGNCVELSEERLGGSAAAADKARTMAMERGGDLWGLVDPIWGWGRGVRGPAVVPRDAARDKPMGVGDQTFHVPKGRAVSQ